MKQASKIYLSHLAAGVDPFRRFLGPEYEVLIPLDGLASFSYAPAYAERYRAMGITDLTYAVNSTMFAAMRILDKLARILGIKFRVIEAWRPLEVQESLWRDNIIKVYNEFQDKVASNLSLQQFIAEFEPDGWRGLKQYGLENSATLVLKPKEGAGLPHTSGTAVDLLPLDGYGRPLTQPKWLARKDPALKDCIKPLGPDFDNVGSPFNTSHIEPLSGAPRDLRLAALNVDFLVALAKSIPPLRNINDENWHFQLADRDREYLPSYRNLSLADARSASPAHVARVRKEAADFAERVFGLFYDRQFEKGVKFNYADSDFDAARVMTLDGLLGRLASHTAQQQKIIGA